MSRSFRKFPRTWLCSHDRKDKRITHKKFRAKTRQLMKQEKYDLLPLKLDEALSWWGWSCDGKMSWFTRETDPHWIQRKRSFLAK